MTAKEVALEKLWNYLISNQVDKAEEQYELVHQALEELEAIKFADGGEAMEVVKDIEKSIKKHIPQNYLSAQFEIIKNFILKAQAQERELKATIKELLDIPITVSTFNGTSLLVKTMNKLNKLVGEE